MVYMICIIVFFIIILLIIRLKNDKLTKKLNEMPINNIDNIQKTNIEIDINKFKDLYSIIIHTIDNAEFIEYMNYEPKILMDVYLEKCINELRFLVRKEMEHSLNKALIDDFLRHNPTYTKDQLIDIMYKMTNEKEIRNIIMKKYVEIISNNVAESIKLDEETVKYNASFGNDNFDDPMSALHPRNTSEDLDTYDFTKDITEEDLKNTNTIEEL